MKTVKLAIFLALVSALSGLCLSAVNDMTAPIISEAAIAKERANLQQIYTGGETFEVVDADFGDYTTLQGVYKVSNGDYVYKGSTKGYGGTCVYLVAIGADGKFKGFAALDLSNETNGFGSRVGTDEFKNNVVGTGIDESIDTLSGATVTSSAIVNSIKEAVAHYTENYK